MRVLVSVPLRLLFVLSRGKGGGLSQLGWFCKVGVGRLTSVATSVARIQISRMRALLWFQRPSISFSMRAMMFLIASRIRLMNSSFSQSLFKGLGVAGLECRPEVLSDISSLSSRFLTAISGTTGPVGYAVTTTALESSVAVQWGSSHLRRSSTVGVSLAAFLLVVAAWVSEVATGGAGVLARDCALGRLKYSMWLVLFAAAV